jgi:hypothetical protein
VVQYRHSSRLSRHAGLLYKKKASCCNERHRGYILVGTAADVR